MFVSIFTKHVHVTCTTRCTRCSWTGNEHLENASQSGVWTPFLSFKHHLKLNFFMNICEKMESYFQSQNCLFHVFIWNVINISPVPDLVHVHRFSRMIPGIREWWTLFVMSSSSWQPCYCSSVSLHGNHHVGSGRRLSGRSAAFTGEEHEWLFITIIKPSSTGTR